MKCPRCGHENENRSVCEKCGNFLQHGKRLPKEEMSPAERRKYRLHKVWVFIKSFFTSTVVLILAFIVLSIIMFGIFYLVTKNMDWELTPEEEAAMISELQEINEESEDDGEESEEDGEESAEDDEKETEAGEVTDDSDQANQDENTDSGSDDENSDDTPSDANTDADNEDSVADADNDTGEKNESDTKE